MRDRLAKLVGHRTTPRSGTARRTSLTGVAILLAAAVTLSPSASASAETSPPGRSAAAGSLTSTTPNPKQVTFGLQTSGAKAPDGRGVFLINAGPGARTSDHVAVENYGLKPVTLNLYAADAYNTDTGGFALQPRAKRATDVGAWVTIKPGRVTVPARSKVILPISVSVPSRATPGDHVGAVLGSFLTVGKDAKGNLVNLEERTGIRIYLRVSGKLRPRLAVDELTAGATTVWNPLGRTRVRVRYRVRNTGNVRLAAIQAVRISNLSGLAKPGLKQPDIEELLPGGSAEVTVDVTGIRPAGPMSATVVLDPKPTRNDTNPDIAAGAQLQRSRSFWSIPWTTLLLVLVIIALAVRYLLRFLRRRSRGAGPGGPVPGRPIAAGTVPGLNGSRVAGVGTDVKGSHGPREGRSGRSERPGAVQRRSWQPSRPHQVGPALAVALAAVIAAVALMIGSPPASAASSGSLAFLPSKGMDVSSMYMYTSNGCPAGTKSIFGTITGNGLPADGLPARDNQSVGISTVAPFEVPFGDSFASLAQLAGTKLRAGSYVVTLYCVDAAATRVLGTFVGTVTFTDAHHYTAGAPPAGSFPYAKGRMAAGQIPIPFEQADPTTIAKAAGGSHPSAAAAARPSPQEAAAGPAAGQEPAAEPAHRGSASPMGWVLAGALLVALALGGAMLYQHRRHRDVADPTLLPWPDGEPGRHEPSPPARVPDDGL